MMRKNVSVQVSFSLGEEKKREHKRQHTSARKVAKHHSEEASEVSCFLKTVGFTFSENVKVRHCHFFNIYPFNEIFLCFSHFSDSIDIVINIFLKRKSKILGAFSFFQHISL